MTGLSQRGTSRRDVLRLMAGGAAAGALAGCSGESVSSPASTTTTTLGGRPSPVPFERRKLVVIELGGGNDSLSTLVPMENGPYHDARPTLAIADEDLIPFREGYGLPRYFEKLNDQGLTFLVGVGTPEPSLSHFEMLNRWWMGRPDQVPSRGPGFLGRLCDRLGAQRQIVGVSVGRLPTPALASEHPTTVGLPDPGLLGVLPGAAPGVRSAVASALEEMGAGVGGSGLVKRYGTSLGTALNLDDMLSALPPRGSGYDGMEPHAQSFADQLSFAGQLLRADSGVRVVYLQSASTIFDTHGGHAENQVRAWGTLLPGLERFREELEESGLSDEVMIMTTSEFGRRVAENGDGLDHGAASCALLMGPQRPGIVGDHPSLVDLDEDGNQKATVSFDRYQATMAAWLDVDPSSVLDGSPEPIEALLRV
jgi:uncharacterized protein (DUF1501 family)